MSEIETIEVPLQGVAIKSKTGVTLWKPVFYGVDVQVDGAGNPILRAWKGEQEIVIPLGADTAAHLAKLLSRN